MVRKAKWLKPKRESKYVNRVGVELEVAVPRNKTRLMNGLNEFFEAGDDCSISTQRRNHTTKEYRTKNGGVPMNVIRKITSDIYSQNELIANRSMGLHIHVSMKNEAHRRLLADVEFYYYFMGELTKTPLMKYRNQRWRLGGDCEWCTSNIGSRGRFNTDGGAIRFNTGHGTIEFRIFPAMDTAAQVSRAYGFVFAAIDDYLDKKIKELR